MIHAAVAPARECAESRRSRVVLAGLLLAAGLVTSCAGVDVSPVRSFTLEDEWELGARLAAQVEPSLEVVPDEQAQRLLEEMAFDLVREGAMSARRWRFHLVRSDEAYSFGLPGGHVYVSTGLVRATGDASELAAALAMEIAHGTLRHETAQLTTAYGPKRLLAMALGRDPATLSGVAANLAASGTLARFSRQAEADADAEAQRLLAAAGYSPASLPSLLERLAALGESRREIVSRFMAVHPVDESRVSDARAFAGSLPASSAPRADATAYATIKGAS